jgi:hypothetical protein
MAQRRVVALRGSRGIKIQKILNIRRKKKTGGKIGLVICGLVSRALSRHVVKTLSVLFPSSLISVSPGILYRKIPSPPKEEGLSGVICGKKKIIKIGKG